MSHVVYMLEQEIFSVCIENLLLINFDFPVSLEFWPCKSMSYIFNNAVSLTMTFTNHVRVQQGEQ